MYVIEQLLSTIAPHRCLACGREGSPLCLPCSNTLPPAPRCCYKCGKIAAHGLCPACSHQSALQSITVRTLYAGIAQQTVHQLKFERNRAMAAILGRSMTLCRPGIITHVPTASRRVRQRGYDQAALIAKAVAKTSGNPYQPLLRRQGSQRQLGKTRLVRQRQLQAAFYMHTKNLPPHNMTVILIDDVMTTGATFEAAAQTLRQAGYWRIRAHAFAWKDLSSTS